MGLRRVIGSLFQVRRVRVCGGGGVKRWLCSV